MAGSGRRWFNMPAAHQDPAVERNSDLSIYKVLREVVGFTAAIRAEVRLLRRELQQLREEVKMSFEELSANIDALIAEAVKDVTAAVAQAARNAPNDATIAALNTKVTGAMQTLKDTFATLPTAPAAGTVVVTDPVTGTASTVDTGSPNLPGDTVVVPPPAPVDPNAPVQ
jgi:hypothetical protein